MAAIPEIRKELVKIQREIDRSNGVVMDGRDIGSIVFPDARFIGKVFMVDLLTRMKFYLQNLRYTQLNLFHHQNLVD